MKLKRNRKSLTLQNVTADELYIIERALYKFEEETNESIDFWSEQEQMNKWDKEYFEQLKARAQTINSIIKSIDITTVQ